MSSSIFQVRTAATYVQKHQEIMLFGLSAASFLKYDMQKISDNYSCFPFSNTLGLSMN